MKKVFFTFLAFVFLSTPIAMGSMHDDTYQAEEAVICVSDCFEETAHAKSRLADLQDLDILPLPPSPPPLLTISLGFTVLLLYSLAQTVLRRDHQSLFCSYLE